MNSADIDRLEKIVDAAKKISPFEHADDHFKFSDEIMLSMPLLIKSWREMSAEIEHLNTVISTQSHELDLLRALSEVNMALKQGAKIHRLEKALDKCRQQRDEWINDVTLDKTITENNAEIGAILMGE